MKRRRFGWLLCPACLSLRFGPGHLLRAYVFGVEDCRRRRAPVVDKRDVCGCHKGCTTLPHACARPCVWPACLSAAEHARLAAEIEAV